jgi:hypothetical protein
MSVTVGEVGGRAHPAFVRVGFGSAASNREPTSVCEFAHTVSGVHLRYRLHR